MYKSVRNQDAGRVDSYSFFDAEDKDVLETQFTDVICNASLDPYITTCFHNYAYNLSDTRAERHKPEKTYPCCSDVAGGCAEVLE